MLRLTIILSGLCFFACGGEQEPSGRRRTSSESGSKKEDLCRLSGNIVPCTSPADDGPKKCYDRAGNEAPCSQPKDDGRNVMTVGMRRAVSKKDDGPKKCYDRAGNETPPAKAQ